MKIESLNLIDQTCPMALLMAKRHCAQLCPGATTTIFIADQTSALDIIRYLMQNGFTIEISPMGDNYQLIISK
ncbi:MAG: sulfurtransferase TusA family protein [Vibrio sp.]